MIVVVYSFYYIGMKFKSHQKFWKDQYQKHPQCLSYKNHFFINSYFNFMQVVSFFLATCLLNLRNLLFVFLNKHFSIYSSFCIPSYLVDLWTTIFDESKIISSVNLSLNIISFFSISQQSLYLSLSSSILFGNLIRIL